VYPIVVLVTSQVSEATKIRLKSICNQTIPVEAIICPYKNNEHEASWTNSELTKLHIWNLLQFEKVVYLDADTLVIENIGELFEIQSSFAASPDIFPPDKFNAGLLVIQPNASVFHEMISLVGVLSSHDGGDTGFLNSYFSNWYVFISHYVSRVRY
jgi:glycogenin glucosyltransferase